MKNVGLFFAGFVSGFVVLFALIMIYGDYEDEPVTPVVVAQMPPAEATQPASAPVPVLPTDTPVPLPTPAPVANAPTVDTVLSAFESAGIQVRDVDRAPHIEAESPLPRSFRQHAAWNDALLGDSGGQLFICDSPDLCAALSAYFQMFVGMAGPYIYTSPSGLVVVQLNSGFTPDQAARYRTVLDRF